MDALKIAFQFKEIMQILIVYLKFVHYALLQSPIAKNANQEMFALNVRIICIYRQLIQVAWLIAEFL